MIRKHIETLRVMAEDQPGAFGYRVAAMVILRNKIVSLGWNQEKTHTFQLEYAKNPHARYWHAETHAIHNARRKLSEADFKKAKLIVVRLKRKNVAGSFKFGSAKPCAGCQKCIEDHGIKTVYYSTESTFDNPHYVVGDY
jgi:deoxycytidylate deaminase